MSPPPDPAAGIGATEGPQRPIPDAGPIPDLAVREARAADMAAVQAIYAPHVVEGFSSFEETPPDAAEMLRRFEEIAAKGFPYLVAESGGQVLGYSYANTYRTRSAYRFTVENSIYVRPGLLGRGIGRALLADLKLRCVRLGFRQMIAVIGTVTPDSPSIQLHRRHGFREAARLSAIGFKRGRWVDGVIMQCALGEGDASPPSGD